MAAAVGSGGGVSSGAPKLYIDRMSQPCRTVVIFCKSAGVPFEEVRTAVSRGDQRKPDFLAVNPLGKLPALQEGSFCLPESAAIMRYLCHTRQVADHWYPSDPQARARVSSALDWHGSTLRVAAMAVVWNRALTLTLGHEGNEAVVTDWALPNLKRALKAIDTVWLRDSPFLAGQHQISIADLLLSCEIEQLCLLDAAAQGPTMDELLRPHAHLRAWLVHVREASAPHYDEVHALLRKARDRLVARQQQQASKL
ncbi:hypothetical protein ABPG75_011040 [Micractinium tetrahymenae]